MTPEQQFDLLRSELRSSPRRGAWVALANSRFDGRLSRVAELFTITRAEYLAWAQTLPLEAFVGTAPDSFDGDYLLQERGGWVLYAQEREMRSCEKRFATEAEARAHVMRHCSPFGIYRALRE